MLACHQVKCDANQPKCSPCNSSGSDCIYPPDARRSARASKADIRALRNEILVLRRLVHERGIQYQISEDLGELLNDPDTGLSSNNHGALQSPPHTEQNIESLPSPEIDHQGRRATLSHPSPGSLGHGQNISYQSTLSTPGSHIAPVNTHGGIDGSDARYRERLSSEAHIAGAMTEDGQVRVHGVTSTLHQPAAVEPIEDIQPELESASGYQDHITTEHLISNAAIQRQREIAFLSSPHVGTRIDFDGLEPEMAIHLLDLHWNRHHLGYLYTYRPAVMDSLINGGPHANKLLLNAMYYASSLFSDRVSLRSDPQDPQTQGDRFYYRFKQLLVDEIDSPSIPSANALLLCGSSLVSHGKQSAGWVLCGIAYRMITDLGCHLSIQSHQPESPDKSRCSSMEIEIRKRFYWGAFIMDKFQSLYMGRPPMLRPAEARVSKTLHDTYEELELWTPYIDSTTATPSSRIPAYQPRPTYAVSTLQSLVVLAEITSKVVDSFYSMESIRTSRDVCLQTKLSIENDLDEWQMRLPQHLRFDSDDTPTPPPHQITPQ